MAKSLEELIRDGKPLIEAAADAICVLDTKKQMRYANESYDRMMKRGSTELVSDIKNIIYEGEILGEVIIYHDISDVQRLKRELDRLNSKLRKVEKKIGFQDIIGKDAEMLKVIGTAKVASMTPATIMLRGESGTGKEIFANAIHNNSPRRNENFVKINCSSLPEELLESELFGYKEGAFTGARRGGKKGLFQMADKGTLFLDEIGDVSPLMQVKLLRVLQEREIMPVGSTESIPVDVRIICATHKPLEDMIERGEFREDLYYRLNVFPLFIPPLRQRKEDIGLIAECLLGKYNEFYHRHVLKIEEDAVTLLKEREWYGNVRELENILSRAMINLDAESEILTREDFEFVLDSAAQIDNRKEKKGKAERIAVEQEGNLPVNLHEAVEQTEMRCIQNALENSGGDKNKAAVALGIPLRTLYYKCNKLQIK